MRQVIELVGTVSVGPSLDPASGPWFAQDVSAGQRSWPALAPVADFFLHHGRQAMLGNSAPKALDIHPLLASAALWWVTAAAAAITIAVLVLHRHLRSHHLRSKVRYDLLPTTSFDPTLAGVLRFAHQLGRVRPVHGWVPQSVVGVRVRFGTDDLFGKMVMSVEGRKSITGVINKLVYPDVEIRRNAPADGETTSASQGETTSHSIVGETSRAAGPAGLRCSWLGAS